MGFKKGYTPWNKGTHLTEEYKKKLSDALKGRVVTEEHRKHLSEANKDNPKCKTFLGKHHTEEHKKHMSVVMKEKAPWKGKKLSPEHRMKILKRTRGRRISKGEKEVLAFVKERYNGKIIENDRTFLDGYELDIYIPELKLAIEYLGEYYHGPDFPHVVERDAWKRKECRKRGVALIDIWEKDWHDRRDSCENFVESLITMSMKEV